MSRPSRSATRARRRPTVVAVLTLLAALLIPGHVTAAHADVVPGSEADIQITVSGPTAANTGEAFTYRLVMQNNSTPDADGATFDDVFSGGVTGVQATCSAAGGAECPATLAVSNSGVSGTLGAFPRLGVVTVTITGTYTGVATVTNTATISPPTGVTDPDTTTNTSFVSTAIEAGASLSVQKTASPAGVAPGGTITYTVTYRNAGPRPADGAAIEDYLRWAEAGTMLTTFSTRFTSCVPTNGAVCPTFTDRTGLAEFARTYNTTIPTLPAGSSITITYDVTLADAGGCTARADSRVESFAFISAPSGVRDADSTDNGATTRTPVAPRACPEADLRVTKTADRSSVAPGDAVTYTVTYANAGPSPANGARILDQISETGTGSAFSTYDARDFSCVAVGGAVCPTLPNALGQSVRSSNATWNTAIPTFPAGSSITIVYTDTFADPDGCAASADATITNQAQIGAPPGTTDGSSLNNVMRVTLPAEAPLCARADLRVEKSGDPLAAPGGETSFTVTYRNLGPADADGTAISDLTRSFDSGVDFSTYDVAHDGCSTTGGAVCPSLSPSSDVPVAFGRPFQSTIPTFPAGSTVTLRYTLSFAPTTEAECTGADGATFVNSATLSAPAGVTDNPSDNLAEVRTPARCAEISVNSSVAPDAIRSGEAFEYTIVVTNAGVATADAIDFRDPLIGGLVYGSSSCEPVALCGPLTFDAASNTVSSRIPRLAPDQSVTIKVRGTAGVQAGTFTNIASAQPSAESGYYDPNPASNASRVNLQVFNTVSPITVTKTVEGVPAGGLPESRTFTGTISCETQAAKAWSVTVPAGSVTATGEPVQFFDGESCTVSEDAPGEAPEGYVWVGEPRIAPGTIDRLGPSTPVAVEVTNTLAPAPGLEAALIVTKQVTGLPAGGLAAATTFGGDVLCTSPNGERLLEPWSVTVPAGASSASTSPTQRAAGSTCSVSESTPPTAPDGYEWDGQPVIEPASAGPLAPESTTEFTVTNALAAAEAEVAALEITKTVDGGPDLLDGQFDFLVRCGAAGDFTGQVTLQGARSGTTTVANIPVGADCTVEEVSVSAPPEGYRWGAPVIDTAAVRITDGGASVEVVNPLTELPQPVASVVITKQVAGLPAGGLPAATEFSGDLLCTLGSGERELQPWTVTVGEGQTSASTPPIQRPVGATCTVSESTPPAAPAGYEWSGAPSIEPATSGPLATDSTASFTVTNTLAAAEAEVAQLEIRKLVEGGPAAIDGRFGFIASCGAAGDYAGEVVFTEAKRGSTVLLNVPVGAECRIEETAVSLAPQGYRWDAPRYEAQTVRVDADGAQVTVVNPLDAVPVDPPGPGTMSGDGTPGDGTPPGATRIERLAVTGAELGAAVPLAAGLLVLAGVVLVLARRRQRESTRRR